MRKNLLLISTLTISCLSTTLRTEIANAQTCAAGGCTSAAETNQYPTTTFSTTSSSWTTVSAYMNAGNWTLFNVTSGDTYEWTYCSNFGGLQGWDAELTLFNNSSGATLCYADNCGLTGCVNAPYINWTATFTGTVSLLTTVSGCTANTGSPYSTLVWRDASGAASTQVLGVDVSSYQGTINWTQVKAAGITFAWAKATEGLTVADADYHNNAVNGVAAGVYMGAYHFAHPDDNPTNANAISEANYFLSKAQSYIVACELPPVLDYEVSPSLTWAQQTTWIQNWMNTVQNATGITPIIYTSGSIASSLGSSLTVYPLWMADPDGSSTVAPPTLGPWAPNWAFKQYSWTGTVSGISGQSDLDVFNGNSTALNTLMGCTTSNPPVANFNTSVSTACVGQSISLTDNSTYSPTSWAWTMTGGNPASSTSQNPSVTYTTAGTYTISLVATNTAGSSASFSKTVTINPLPTVTASSAQTICSGQSATITGSDATTYSWNTGASTSSITVNPTALTTYTVTGTANGCSNSATSTITVNPNPAVPTITVNGNALTSSSSSNNQWYLNGVLINGAINQTDTAIQTGAYTVVVTNAFGCSASSVPTNVTVTGITSILNNDGLTLYPNPTNGSVTINFSGKSEHLNINVFNDLGQLVYTEQVNDCSKDCNKTIDLSSLHKGIYLFKIDANESVYMKKILLVK